MLAFEVADSESWRLGWYKIMEWVVVVDDGAVEEEVLWSMTRSVSVRVSDW